ncbi:tRNA lysidine(34) synthetase TilS [Alphaproteobacteria bacterium]|nr:tRNA lysidine(34) synthetase TilS [Alphaproteobacteria bacterium]
MKILQNSFNQYLNKNYFFEKKPTIAVAVSGGPDSMCLIYLLKNWININQGNIVALIIDHQLRKESKEESYLIKKYLLKNKISTKIIKINKKLVIKKSMKEARNNRYEKLIKYCNRENILHLFLAHHYNDNIETFLIRKLSGSNFEGLRGMQHKSINNSIQILRPLLIHTKKEILEFNLKNKIFYLNDPSNLNTKYTRVAVRNFLNENRVIYKKIKKDFEKIKKYYPIYLQMVYKIFNKIIIKINNKNILIESDRFFEQNKEIQVKIIEIIYKFLMPTRQSIRSKKIYNLLENLLYNKIVKANLGGIDIKKDDFSINFSL